MYQPVSLATPTGTVAAALASQARDHRLTVYAGAGISAAEPTNLPGAAKLAELVYNTVMSAIALDGVDRRDLVAVGDRVAAEPHGVQLLRSTILQVADLTGARYNYAHQALALLLCEGAVTVLETNYDDCIERAAYPERLPVVVTDADRLDVHVAALLKAHGCATHPKTMLVTSTELADPPMFARTELANRLSLGTVAFIGIGSPADYVKASLKAIISKVGAAKLIVVGPQMVNWVGSGWARILPTLADEDRVDETADGFMDALMRAYLASLMVTVRSKVQSMPEEHPQRTGIEVVLNAIGAKDGVTVLRWLRQATWRFPVGAGVAVSGETVRGLLALGALSGGASVAVRRTGWTDVDQVSTQPSVPVLLLLSSSAPLGTEAAAEAQMRVTDARTDERVVPGDDVIVLCSGQVGPLGPDEVTVPRGARIADVLAARNRDSALDAVPINILDEPDPVHLLDSIGAGRVLLLSAETLIEAA